MAAASHSGEVNRHAPVSAGAPAVHRQSASGWLLAIGLALLLAFAAATWVQLRQVSLVSAAMRHEGDNLLWSFFQLELEAANLREALHVARRDPLDAIGQEGLRRRYEIFASRLPLVDPERTGVLLEFGPQHRRTLRRIQAFLDRYDTQLSESVATVLQPAVLEQALQDLQGLLTELHDLALEGNRYPAEQVAERNRGVAEQVRLGIGLTVFQCALALVFAMVVLRQFGALQRRGLELEQLTRRLQEARAEAEAASQAKSVFLANMSHELRTPFTGMLGMLTLLESIPLTAQQRDHLHVARDSARHLLSNALKFTESGRLDLKVSLSAGQTASAGPAGPAAAPAADSPHVEAGRLLRLRIDVCDTGIGMDPATQARLFQRFSQGDASTSRRFGGSGLGLEISRALARLMGGDIGVHSRPGEGSVFSLMLPVQLCEPMHAALAPARSEGDASSEDSRRLPLLVVDDHPVNRRYMSLLLERMGHRVSLAQDGQEALDRVQQEPPDLVFMDVHMPGLDGLAATRLLRQLAAPANAVPVVALTADAFLENRERVMEAGMDDFLVKPAAPDEASQLLRRRFGARATPPHPHPQPDEDGPAALPALQQLIPAEVAEHLNIDTIGDLRNALGAAGYGRLLQRFFADEVGTWRQRSVERAGRRRRPGPCGRSPDGRVVFDHACHRPLRPTHHRAGAQALRGGGAAGLRCGPDAPQVRQRPAWSAPRPFPV
jgi:hypothetical protein